MSQPSPTLAYSLLALAALFWTGNWVVGRMLADLVPPSALTFWRWAIAVALLMPFVGPRLWSARRLLVREWRPIAVLGLLGGGLHNVLQYWGLDYTLATNGAILNATTPVLIIVLGTLVFRDPFPRRAAAGAMTISLPGGRCSPVLRPDRCNKAVVTLSAHCQANGVNQRRRFTLAFRESKHERPRRRRPSPQGGRTSRTCSQASSRSRQAS